MKWIACVGLTASLVLSGCGHRDKDAEVRRAKSYEVCHADANSIWGEMCEVSMVTLITRAEELSGMRVRVSGYVRRLPDYWLLCLTEAAAKFGNGTDCLAFQIETEKLKDSVTVMDWRARERRIKEFGNEGINEPLEYLTLVGVFRREPGPGFGYFGRLEDVVGCC